FGLGLRLGHANTGVAPSCIPTYRTSNFKTFGGANELAKLNTDWVLGGSLPWSCSYNIKARPTCRILLKHRIRLPFSFANDKAGRSIPARMAIMAITTSNSINVKPRRGPRKQPSRHGERLLRA